MTLEYIKLNNRKLEFKEGVNYILGDSNSGKTTLYGIIKFIYGGNEHDGQDFKSVGWQNLMNAVPNVIIEWKFYGEEKFTLKLSSRKIKFCDKYLSLDEYKKKILSKPGFEHIIFGKSNKTINSFTWDKSPEKITESSSNYGKFFDEYGIFNNTTFKFFHLLGEYDNEVEEYFLEVGKKVNYDKINKEYTKVKKNYDQNLIDLVDKNSNQLDRYLGLQRLNKSGIDDGIVDEIKEISNRNIDEIIKFHEILIESYNDVIEEEKTSIKKEISILNDYTREEIRTVKTILDNSEYNRKHIKSIQTKIKTLTPKKDNFEQRVNKISDNMSKTINEYKKEFKLSTEYQFENSITYKKSGKNENFVINLKSCKKSTVKNSGGAEKTYNFFVFLYFTFMECDFPIMMFEKPFFVEVKNIDQIRLLNIIHKKLKNKQILIIQHPESDFLQEMEGNTIRFDKLFNVDY